MADPCLTCLKDLAWLHSYTSFQLGLGCINFTLVDQQSIVRFFDGVEQGGICEVGMVIKIQHNLSLKQDGDSQA